MASNDKARAPRNQYGKPATNHSCYHIQVPSEKNFLWNSGYCMDVINRTLASHHASHDGLIVRPHPTLTICLLHKPKPPRFGRANIIKFAVLLVTLSIIYLYGWRNGESRRIRMWFLCCSIIYLNHLWCTILDTVKSKHSSCAFRFTTAPSCPHSRISPPEPVDELPWHNRIVMQMWEAIL